MGRDMLLLQLCSRMDENAVGTCVELIFAPIDAALSPSGFRIIPLGSRKEASSHNRTFDLASALEIGSAGNKACNNYTAASGCTRSVMTIAFEFTFESRIQENVASMAWQYVRSIISSFQRVALAFPPSHLDGNGGLRPLLRPPGAHTLGRWICQSYICCVELLK